jgi:protein-tyrosine phosphatase
MLPKAPPGTYWIPIGAGAVLAGPHPVLAAEGMEARVKRLVEGVGVSRFVDLSSSEDWMPPYRSLLSRGCEYLRYEILDRRLPVDTPKLQALIELIIADAQAGQLSYMHCQAGLGRTGTVVGCLLRELGFAGQAALDELVRLRWEARLHEGSPEFEEQREFVRAWQPVRPGA